MSMNDKKAELHKLTTARTKLATAKRALLVKMTPEALTAAKIYAEVTTLEAQITKAIAAAGGK